MHAAGSSVRREVVAGLTTYFTLCYIVFVQPAVLAQAGVPTDGALFATCVASALACFLMAWLANYPVALAPAMGHNFFFAFAICGAFGMTWQQGLAANLIAGAFFLVLAGTRLRETVMHAIPDALKAALAAGIGLLIALLGLEWGNIVVDHPQTYVQLGDLSHPVALLSLFGLSVTAVLVARGWRAAILLGMAATLAAGLVAPVLFGGPDLVRITGVVGSPPPPSAAFALDFAGLFEHPVARWLGVIGTLLILDLFDTAGTLIGVAQRAGLMVGGRLPRARQAFAADAGGTVAGALLGTSTVTSYVESAAGVAAGGRTGLVAVVVGICLLLSLFFAPLVEAIGAGVAVAADPAVVRYPVVAPVLIVVGVLMAGAVRSIEWDRPSEAIPAFLTMVLIPLSFSITDGLAFGMIAYSVLGLATGRQVHPVVHGCAVLFVLRYVLLS